MKIDGVKKTVTPVTGVTPVWEIGVTKRADVRLY